MTDDKLPRLGSIFGVVTAVLAVVHMFSAHLVIDNTTVLLLLIVTTVAYTH